MSTIHDPMRETISLHGLGFIQVQLQGNQRLHVWHPDLPRRICYQHSAIHDHRFSFHSTVLVGAMRNITYDVQQTAKRGEDGQLIQLGKYMTYSHEGARSKNGGRPWTPGLQVDFTVRTNMVIAAGESYYMPSYAFHKTEPMADGKCATVIKKLSEGEHGARSSCSIGVEPDTDFDRFQLSNDELWWYVFEVLASPQVSAATLIALPTEPGSPEGLLTPAQEGGA